MRKHWRELKKISQPLHADEKRKTQLHEVMYSGGVSLSVYLPEIMDIVGHHLSKGSLHACIRVSRSWHDYFVPILWRSFIFSAYSSQPKPPLEALLKYAHYIRQIEFSGLIPSWYMSIGCKNLDFLKVIGERCIDEDNADMDPLTSLIQDNPGLQRLILFDVGPCPDEAFWNAVAQLTELRSLIVNRTEIPPQTTHAFFRAISAYTPTLRLDKVYFKPIRVEKEEDEDDGQDEEGLNQAEGEEVTMEQLTEESTPQTELNEDTNNNGDKEEDPDVLATFAYEPEVPPGVTFSRLRQLYMFDLTGTGYDKQPWILENAPRLEHLSWRGGYAFEFPTTSITTALESGNLSRLESLELRGSHLSDQEIAQILSRMSRLVKLVAPRTELGPAAMKQLFQHFETVRELDISGCENVRSWMIQMFLCKFVSLEVFVADMLSLQDITTDPWVCSRLRKLSLDFELGYVDKEEGVQDTIEDEEDSDEYEEEDEDEEEEDDEENEVHADVDAIEEEGDEADGDDQAVIGQYELSSSQIETEAIIIGDEEGESATKESDIDVDVAVVEVDMEHAVVETAIAGGDIQGQELVPDVSIASETVVDGVTADSEQLGDRNEAGAVEEGEGEGEGDEATHDFTPEEMAAAQWDVQQMEADAAEAEAEEDPDDLWKNLVPYVHSEARQRIIFERLGQLKYLEELNIKQQTERPYSAAEQLRAGVVQKVLDLSLDNGMDLLCGLTRLREFYFPGPQGMEEREVRWIIEHWGERLTHMTGELNRRRRINRKLLKLLSEHKIDAAMCMF
ncbi:hypothetical protein BGZ95_009009 [Linnemannia exigua]|uniref:F-box domain-containing protein n=1 Tax=Linnemannia exigua TaxID=604196 RepID=A0AAD4DKZ7_9FUNG|nr:hypothetical protein BGZ95_009009 [Linnemannia exigua]